MLAESLSSLFSPHLGGTSAGGLGGLFGGTANAAEQPVQETIINNNYFGNDGNDQNDNGQTMSTTRRMIRTTTTMTMTTRPTMAATTVRLLDS